MKILLLNQAFAPDVVSTAQHAADLAGELSREHQVTVLASRRAYEDPRTRFPARESLHGATILRLACTGFGKASRIGRLADSFSFLGSCCWKLLRSPRFDVVIAMTTPPLLSVVAAAFTALKGGRLVLWMMDLNPDEAIAAGWLRADSLAARVLARLLRFSLDRADRIIVLDRFMRDRIVAKGIKDRKISIIAPWSHDGDVRFDPQGRARFRARHGLEGRFVVMYSGNHSPCHPLDTLLEAAARLSGREDIVFCFAGGGTEAGKVERAARERKLANIVRLPYQPRAELAASLSSADLHVVVMGDRFVCIVHPCKVYNICAVGIPLLFIGPAECHVSDALPAALAGRWARIARHGESDRVARHILEATEERLAPLGRPLCAAAARVAVRRLLPETASLVTGAGSANPRGAVALPNA